MKRLLAKYGPLQELNTLDRRKPNVNALHTVVEAYNTDRWLMVVDTETHRKDDSSARGRWKAGQLYDLAITVTGWNGTVRWKKRWLNRWGKLTALQVNEAVAIMKSRKDTLLCSWGSPEQKYFKQAGRLPDDHSDGMDMKEVVLQFLPGMRNIVNAHNS
eukprot:2628089-Prymnesium_polylepis.1